NPPSQSSGNRNASLTHPSTTSSSSAATGDITRSAAFCPHAPASQFAAIAAGNVPPITNPKYRPPVFAIVAGLPTSSSNSTTRCAFVGPSGNFSLSRANPATTSAVGATLLVPTPATYFAALSAAIPNNS